MIRQTLAAVVAVSVMGSVAFIAPAANAAEKTNTLIIAVEAPLTGDLESLGRDMLRSVRMAADQVNAKGGVNGQRVKIVAIDDKGDPAYASSSVKKATKAKASAVIGIYNSSIGVINLSEYLKAKIVPLHMTSTNDTDGQGVTLNPKNNQIAPVEFDYVSSLGVKTVAMLVDPSTYTQGMADRLKNSLQSQGVTVTTIPVPEGTTNLTAQVNQAIATGAELIYSSTYYPEGSQIAKVLSTSNSSAKCLMGLANVDPAFVTQAGVAASQRCAFSGIPAASQIPGAKAAKFVKQYVRKYKKTPGVWGIFTYDEANVLFAAIEKAGTPSFTPTLKALLQTKNYKGASGVTTIDKKTGNREVVPVYIMDVADNGIFEVKK
jgi:ABC-type branched-subunit amino acid transport system substrate-binding protein